MRHWVLPGINLELCNLCGACVEYCPTRAVEMGPTGPFIARPEDCNYCAECCAVCPEGAISCSFEIVWGDGDEPEGAERP